MDNIINKHTAFSDVITKQRIKTINEMRNLVANIYACIINLNEMKKTNTNDKIKKDQAQVNLRKNIIKLKMLLSIHYEREGNEQHLALENILKKIKDAMESDKENNQKVEDILNDLIKVSRYIFNYEWSRIKEEAR